MRRTTLAALTVAASAGIPVGTTSAAHAQGLAGTVAGPAAVATGPGGVVAMIALASLITAPLRRLARAFELRQTWHVARARADSLLREAGPAGSAGSGAIAPGPADASRAA